jgi:predicted ferric reductase
MSFLGSLGLLSVLYVRQYIFEIFLKSHVISAVGLIGLLWFHVPLRYHLSTICLGIASGLWIMQEAYWVACLGMQNIGSRSPRICDVVIHADPNGSAEALSLTVCLKGSPKSTSGQFLYLTIPRLSRHRAGFAQAHPYAIAWVDNSVVTMFIQRRSGFSNDLFSVPNIGGSGIIVDGPYGSPQQLHTYDKVLFIASGIGIASHLVAIKELLEAHEDKSAQVRRITLVWFLETSGMYLVRSVTSFFFS